MIVLMLGLKQVSKLVSTKVASPFVPVFSPKRNSSIASIAIYLK